METSLAQLFPIRIVRDEGRGRCLIASRDVAAGEVFLRCAAVAVTPVGARCWSCFAKPPSSGLLRCTRCGAVAYCGKACQAADWRSGHREECHPLALEGPADVDLLHSAFLLGRALRATCTSTCCPQVAVAGAAPRPCYYHARADLVAMAAPRNVEDATGAAAVAGLCSRWGLLPSDAEHSEAAALAGAFPVNNFSVTDELLLPTAAAAFPAGALLNHSCAPNACVTYRVVRGSGSGTLVIQEFRALRPVPAGEELCHSYVETAQPRLERARALAERYGFDCACALCSAEGSADHPEAAAALALYGPLEADADAAAARAEAAALLSRAIAGDADAEVPRCAFTFPAALAGMPPLPGAASAGSSGASPADAAAASLQAELWGELVLVERALALLRGRGRVPALHARVQEAVREALNRALALGDMGGALAAGLHSLEFFRRAYRATPCHPMVALQLYALGDVCVRAAAEARAAPPDARRAAALGRLFVGGEAGGGEERRASPLAVIACVVDHGGGARAVPAGLERLAARAYTEARVSLRVSHGPDAPLVGALGELLRSLPAAPPAPLGGGPPAALLAAAGWDVCSACGDLK